MNGDLDYSEDDLAADLRDWWADQVAGDDDPFTDSRPSKAGTIFEVVPVVDSLGAVTALVTVEKHVNFKVPPSVIKAGGYRNFEEMMGHLLPKIRALAVKKRQREAV
jgi:hypothetical protein